MPLTVEERVGQTLHMHYMPWARTKFNTGNWLQVLKLRDHGRSSTCLLNEFIGSKDNRATERAISFDHKVTRWSKKRKGSPCLFGFSVTTWKMEDIEGESPSKTTGKLLEKGLLCGFDIIRHFVNNVRNPSQNWGSTTVSFYGTRRTILPPISLQLLSGLCNIFGMLYLKDQHKVFCYSWQTSLDGLSLLFFPL